MASLNDFLFGKKEKFEQKSILSPQQQQLMAQLMGGLSGPLGQGLGNLQQMLGGNQQFLEQLQAPALRQFQEQILPGIAERFSGLGAQNSSAFGQQLGAAGAGLAENLASQRASLGMQGQQQGFQQLLSLLGLSQAPQVQNIFRPGTEGNLGNILSALAAAAGTAVGGPVGGALGAGIGSLFNKKPQSSATKLEEGNYGLYPTSGFTSLA